MIIDDKRNMLPLKIMYRWVIRISLISSKFSECDTWYVNTESGKYQQNPSTMFRVMINIPSRIKPCCILQQICA